MIIYFLGFRLSEGKKKVQAGKDQEKSLRYQQFDEIYLYRNTLRSFQQRLQYSDRPVENTDKNQFGGAEQRGGI